MEWWKEPFCQIGVPLILTQVTQVVVLVFGFVNQNKRFDDTNHRLDEVITRLDRIENKLSQHDSDIEILKDRSGFVKAH